jgi:hypothetical protein
MDGETAVVARPFDPTSRLDNHWVTNRLTRVGKVPFATHTNHYLLVFHIPSFLFSTLGGNNPPDLLISMDRAAASGE